MAPKPDVESALSSNYNSLDPEIFFALVLAVLNLCEFQCALRVVTAMKPGIPIASTAAS